MTSCVCAMQPPSHPPPRLGRADEKKFQKKQKRACAWKRAFQTGLVGGRVTISPAARGGRR